MSDRHLAILAARCEAATGPDRMLDSDIADLCNVEMPDDPVDWPEHYTASLDAALSLVPEGHGWSYGTHMKRDPVGPAAYVDGCSGIGATPALALCVAALRSRAQVSPAEGSDPSWLTTNDSTTMRSRRP